MRRGDKRYIWQNDDWPHWRCDMAALAAPLAEASHAQGALLGRLADVGMALRDQTFLAAATEDVLRTSEIEGETLNPLAVRSSVARRLGVDIGALAPADRRVEGVVEMVLDATERFADPLTADRLREWHAMLFPVDRSRFGRIAVGQWRDDATGPMQVISGPVGRRMVHFEAPPADCLPAEIALFLDWANADTDEPAFIKAGLAHLWFVTLHPFDDGNGRIARAVGDLFLARADGIPQRFYSMSAQIQRQRRDYYDILERSQKGTLDVTAWLQWFLATLHEAMIGAHSIVDAVLKKSRSWQRWAGMPLNQRQAMMLNRLLDGFEGKLTSSKWATIARCSPDTALRDITQLIDLGILTRTPGGGRSTGYELAE